ncbi:unnamed protein product [Nezara viridula]|uniref:Uncharacterized protein n=1 Tax=Nezara viridula TaxID=85310 RepID=A0A9P0HS56_NEZVI|nr:unnamed protein product [Nezara viridula]
MSYLNIIFHYPQRKKYPISLRVSTHKITN